MVNVIPIVRSIARRFGIRAPRIRAVNDDLLIVRFPSIDASLPAIIGSNILDYLISEDLVKTVTQVNWHWLSTHGQVGIIGRQLQDTNNTSSVSSYSAFISAPVSAPVLSIGGPSASGKSTLVRSLYKAFPNKFIQFPSYTNRPPREDEVEGEEYFFVKARTEEIIAKVGTKNLAFARGFAYWSDRPLFYRSLRDNTDKVHIVHHSRKVQIEQARVRFPRYLSVFLTANPEQLSRRLEERSDGITQSLDYNRSLDGAEFADVVIENIDGRLADTMQSMVTLIESRWPCLIR